MLLLIVGVNNILGFEYQVQSAKCKVVAEKTTTDGDVSGSQNLMLVDKLVASTLIEGAAACANASRDARRPVASDDRRVVAATAAACNDAAVCWRRID